MVAGVFLIVNTFSIKCKKSGKFYKNCHFLLVFDLFSKYFCNFINKYRSMITKLNNINQSTIVNDDHEINPLPKKQNTPISKEW